MQTLDASSIIYAWDNYPELQFPGLWRWLSLQIGSVQLTIPSVALEEVLAKSPSCGVWLKGVSISVLNESVRSLQLATQIQSSLGVKDGKYGNGVKSNDVRIIAIAKIANAELLTDERTQPGLPKSLLNYKIPAVCDLKSVGVAHLSFLEYIKRSKQIFV